MTREEVLRGLERIRDVGVVNHRADMQVIGRGHRDHQAV